MKVLSDFDGVMTDQTEEGRYELEIFTNRLVEFWDGDSAAVTGLIDRAANELSANPTQHGWWSQGRVSAYADEDLFIKVIGIAVCLDHWAGAGDATARRLNSLMKDTFASFASVSNWAYEAMVKHTRSGDIAPMDPIVGDVLRGFLAKGVEVVVVSNSATDRVMELLETVDLEPVAHVDDASAQLRVRGDARKFELGAESEGFELNGFRFDVSRPNYHTIITEELPDAVIGDVFSLDLALPLFLTREMTDKLNKPHILLRTRHYTPEWSKAICTRTDEVNARLGLLDEFGALPSVLGLD